MFFKEPLTEWFFVEQKNGSSIALLEKPFEAPLFFKSASYIYLPWFRRDFNICIGIRKCHTKLYFSLPQQWFLPPFLEEMPY